MYFAPQTLKPDYGPGDRFPEHRSDLPLVMPESSYSDNFPSNQAEIVHYRE